MRRVASLSVRPASELAFRGFAAKAAASSAPSAAAAADPWSNVPQTESALREAIIKATVSGAREREQEKSQTAAG